MGKNPGSNAGIKSGKKSRPMPEAPKYSETRRILRVFFGRKLAFIGFIIIVILIWPG